MRHRGAPHRGHRLFHPVPGQAFRPPTTSLPPWAVGHQHPGRVALLVLFAAKKHLVHGGAMHRAVGFRYPQVTQIAWDCVFRVHLTVHPAGLAVKTPSGSPAKAAAPIQVTTTRGRHTHEHARAPHPWVFQDARNHLHRQLVDGCRDATRAKAEYNDDVVTCALLPSPLWPLILHLLAMEPGTPAVPQAAGWHKVATKTECHWPSGPSAYSGDERGWVGTHLHRDSYV